MIQALIIMIAILAGSVMPVQAGINASLSKMLGHPIHAAVISFLGGFLAMVIISLCSGSFIKWSTLTKVSPLYLTGGLLGSVMVVTSIILAPKLGATVLISCLITGQLMASIILDHYGLVGFQVHPVNTMRIVGIMFLVTGVALVKLF